MVVLRGILIALIGLGPLKEKMNPLFSGTSRKILTQDIFYWYVLNDVSEDLTITYGSLL